jgi:hypothetical protein
MVLSRSHPVKQSADLLQHALSYHRLGWSIIPCRGKKPAVPWKSYQTAPADEETLHRLFGQCRPDGLAVILGPISGGLVCRDFDVEDSYLRWAACQRDLARLLPTAETQRGFHVYFRGPTAYAQLDDGEYRGDSAHYCVVPPSQHPSGSIYRWTVPPSETHLPVLDPFVTGLCPIPVRPQRSGEQHDTAEKHRSREDPQPLTPPHLASLLLCGEELSAIYRRTLPRRAGQRFHCAFRLARALKAVPHLAAAPAQELVNILRQWHSLALPVIRTKDFAETLENFMAAWALVKHPDGTGPLADAVERARSAETPAAAAVFGTHVQSLARLCLELQRLAGDESFPLSCETAGGVLGVSSKTAWWHLQTLIGAGLLQMVERGEQGGIRASRYRWT